jgi:hypothetical protein
MSKNGDLELFNYSNSCTFDKAWDIYELKNQRPKSPTRDNIASLSNSRSEGETSIQQEKDKNFNPFDWNSYKTRL